MRSKSVAIVILMVTCFEFVGCGGTNRKFNKALWDSTGGNIDSHPCRKNMLQDLIQHHNIKGLTCRQVIDSLGDPENYEGEKDSIYYEIVTNYSYLDPKSGTYLAIGFNKDSVVTGFKMVNWKNRHATSN